MTTSETPTTPQDRESRARGYRVNLPFVSAEFRAPHMPRVSMPHVSVPNRRVIGETVGAARNRLPSPAQVAHYSGRAASATVQAIKWPFAKAIGVGAALTGRTASDKDASDRAAARDTTAAVEQEAAREQAAAAKAYPRIKRGKSAGRAPIT